MAGDRHGSGNSDDLVLPFVFTPYGAPEPTEWQARHPEWVRIPATFLPHLPTQPASASGEKDAATPPPASEEGAAGVAAAEPATSDARPASWEGIVGTVPFAAATVPQMLALDTVAGPLATVGIRPRPTRGPGEQS